MKKGLVLEIFLSQKGSTAVRKFPVIVFIHGESYEWNSGNPYDGSVLASYGQVTLSPYLSTFKEPWNRFRQPM